MNSAVGLSLETYRRRVEELEAQLQEAQETLDAIRSGDVDAVVVGGPDGSQVYTLRDADRPYRVLIEQMREGASTLSRDGIVLYANVALANLLDVSPETLVGSSLDRFVADADQCSILDRLLDGGTGELALRSAHGRTVPVQVAVSVLPLGENGGQQVACAVVTDLTEERRRAGELANAQARVSAEAARVEGEGFARLILESATDYAIIATDRDAQVTTWNSGAERIFGWTSGEMNGRGASLIWTEEDRACAVPQDEMARCLRSGRAVNERWHLRRDGTMFWASGLMMPLRGGKGEHLGYLKILRDRSRSRAAEAALRESEERLQFALSAGGMGAWELDLQTLMLTASDHCRANFGVSPSVSFTYGDLICQIHPEDRERQEAAVDRAVALCEDYDIEYRVIDPNTREVRWVAIRGRPTYAEDGAPLRMAGVSSDITARKLVEVALRESETRYRTLFEAIDAGFCIVEVKFDEDRNPIDYRHVEINPAFERQSGVSGYLGRWVSEAVPDLERHWVDTFGHVALTGQAVRFENMAEPLGRWFDVHAFRTGAPYENRVAILFNDISARRRAELALREINETLEERIEERSAALRLYHNIVQSDAAPVVAFDPAFRVTAFNKAHGEHFLRAMGQEARVGDVLPDRFPPDQAIVVRHLMTRALAGEAFTVREAFGDPALVKPYWEISYNPLRDEAGQIVGAFHHAVDITLQLRAQAELEAAQEALRQSQKMEAVGQLTGGVAHDFNNLLTIIKSSTDLLRRPGLADDRRERYVNAISDTVDRAAKLTGQLLAFARRQALMPEVFEPAYRVRGIVDMLHTIVGSRVQIATNIRGDDCLVEADISQFETALVNMAVNARDAMNAEGRLTITVESVSGTPPTRGQAGNAGAFVAVSLADTGSGIEADKLGQIFEPFYTTKEVGKGTGLGLSQVFGFAKQSGGDVGVESEIGIGTCFTLYLPRVEGQPATQGATDARRPEVENGGSGQRVLVVEDNVDVGTFSTQLLSDLGYATTWAANAEQALKLLSEQDDFDVVFSDVVMPGVSGVELGHEIRRLYPYLPVVLTSGYSHVLAEEGRHGFELLQKPYAVEDLSRVLMQVTCSRRVQQEPNIR